MFEVRVLPDKQALGRAAAEHAAQWIRRRLDEVPTVHLIAATGASQFEFLEALAREPDVDWRRTVFFHLDEYVGLPETHPASFRRYLRERVEQPLRPGGFHYVCGDAPDPSQECERLGALIRAVTIDMAFIGIGENGHIAFNDPPADFEIPEPYIVVELDEACRRQQLGEGWFPALEAVPRRAISMSIQQILKSRRILCIVPDRRKAEAVRNTLEGDITPMVPASILRRHPDTLLLLDRESASLLKPETLERWGAGSR